MMVPLACLLAMGVTNQSARNVLLPLNLATDKFKITNKLRICGFVAQCAHESNLFQSFKEDLFYRDPERIARIFKSKFDQDANGVITPDEVEFARQYVGKPEKLANRVYASRFGNGDEASGDGWRYRGRGSIGITFKDNYAAAESACGRPYVKFPDLLLGFDDGCLAGAWCWDSRGCNELMDANDFPSTTRKINPAMVGAKERHRLLDLALEAFE